MRTTTTIPEAQPPIRFPNQFQELVRRELDRARSLHPRPINSFHEGSAVLKEEYEEFWEEVRRRGNKRDLFAVADELVQVAAVAQRIYEDVLQRGNVS